MKNKFITTVVATALALTMTFSLANGMDVKAAEITEDSLVAAEDTNVGNESVDIQQQEPVEISELETTENNDLSKSSESITVDESIAEDILATQADTAVVVGTVSDYLTAKGDAKLYNINLPAGVYLQAQLTTPANADLDYDLYLLDAEGNILTGSDYYTYINGTAGTLPEALGYITSGDTATYYLYVLASEGGSVSESFTLDYSVSTACDSYEIDESVRQALAFTYGAGGAYIESRNLSSPIDNDWYVITVPSSRIYDKLKISATTASTNTCSVEVYQNVASEGYQMKRVGSGNTISVSSGKYYIRVSNAKTMENFDDLDIQNYKLSMVFCADCGSKLSYRSPHSQHRPNGKTYDADSSFVCSSYRQMYRDCTMHFIKASVLEALALDAVQKVAAYVLENEEAFTERIQAQWDIAQSDGMVSARKEITATEKRIAELDNLVKGLYEGNMSGKIPDRQFEKLMAQYDGEQIALENRLAELKAALEETNSNAAKPGKFITLVRKYRDYAELTDMMLHEFIEKIVVHEADKSTGDRIQRVDIFFNFIGQFEVPEVDTRTPEQIAKDEKALAARNREREQNKLRMRRVRAEKKAAEEAAQHEAKGEQIA